jgi:hypothetical protein
MLNYCTPGTPRRCKLTEITRWKTYRKIHLRHGSKGRMAERGSLLHFLMTLLSASRQEDPSFNLSPEDGASHPFTRREPPPLQTSPPCPEQSYAIKTCCTLQPIILFLPYPVCKPNLGLLRHHPLPTRPTLHVPPRFCDHATSLTMLPLSVSVSVTSTIRRSDPQIPPTIRPGSTKPAVLRCNSPPSSNQNIGSIM